MQKRSLQYLLLFCCMLVSVMVSAQVDNDPFNSSRKKVGGSNVSAFNQNRASNFNDYRQKLNAEYVNITREKWKDFNSFRGLLRPDRDFKPVVPISMSDDDARKERLDNRIDINSSITPIYKNSQPVVIAPINEVTDNNPVYVSFSYLGTTLSIRKSKEEMPKLNGIDESSVANAWEKLCDNSFNNTVIDCIKLRSTHQLCDWAYLMMLKALSESYCGVGTDEATLLMAFVYSQSGYKIRLAQHSGKLEMLYACQHNVYDVPYFECDGDKFYAMSKLSGSVKINEAKYPKEQSLSLWVNSDPKVDFVATPERVLISKRYPDMSIHVRTNKNLLPFFYSYPTSEVGGNFMTRWAMYANTPICKETKNDLYSQLKNSISGRSLLESVERLLNWVQTAFEYEYDDKVWGGDRAFFSDETLYYPYCDCEDRAILFTRLVRDLVGLKCVLIYYPGHLASAINFTESVQGDYINVNGVKFVVCDPTYIGASVGHTMPNMDNKSAKVILLQ